MQDCPQISVQTEAPSGMHMVKTYQYARVVGYCCQNDADVENLVRRKEIVELAGPKFLRDSIGTGIRIIINSNF